MGNNPRERRGKHAACKAVEPLELTKGHWKNIEKYHLRGKI